MTNPPLKKEDHSRPVLGKNVYLYAFTEADRGINVLSCESGDFQKRRTFVYLWTDENGGFLIRHDVMHHILIAPRMLCEGCYRISSVLDWRKRFEYATCGRVFFRKRKGKKSPVSTDGALSYCFFAVSVAVIVVVD